MTSPLPKYARLAAELRERVDAEQVGTPVESERTLAERSGVSRMTARKALDALEREGRITRHVGRGSFVARPAVSVPLTLSSFSDDMRARGLTPSSVVLELDEVHADADLSRRFGIAGDQLLVRLTRLRQADGRPIAIERTHLLASSVPGITHGIDFTTRSLYSVLEHDHGIRFDTGEQTIRAGIIEPRDAEVLGVDAGTAVLEFVRISAVGGVVVEHTTSTYAADRFELSARILPQPATAQGSGRRSALRARG